VAGEKLRRFAYKKYKLAPDLGDMLYADNLAFEFDLCSEHVKLQDMQLPLAKHDNAR